MRALFISKFLKYKYINFSLLDPAISRKPINGVRKKRQKQLRETTRFPKRWPSLWGDSIHKLRSKTMQQEEIILVRTVFQRRHQESRCCATPRRKKIVTMRPSTGREIGRDRQKVGRYVNRQVELGIVFFHAYNYRIRSMDCRRYRNMCHR